MTPMLLGTVGVLFSAVIATAGFVCYAATARFWHSRGGWHVFWYMLMIAWVLDLSSISHLFDPPWFAWLRVGTFAVGMPVVLAWQSWIIFDLQLWHRPRGPKAYREADSRPAGEQEETHAA